MAQVVVIPSVAVARPDLDDVDEFDEYDDEPPQPWHNSTGAVLGASAIGLAVIVALVGAVVYVTKQDPPVAPIEFVEPTFSEPGSAAPSTPTTTPTITSTAPISTTEINPPLTPTTPGSETSGTETSDTETSDADTGAESPSRTRQRRDDDDGPTRTTRNRPRTNVTRTLLPQQAG